MTPFTCNVYDDRLTGHPNVPNFPAVALTRLTVFPRVRVWLHSRGFLSLHSRFRRDHPRCIDILEPRALHLTTTCVCRLGESIFCQKLLSRSLLMRPLSQWHCLFDLVSLGVSLLLNCFGLRVDVVWEYNIATLLSVQPRDYSFSRLSTVSFLFACAVN